jgi:hypothetical protein
VAERERRERKRRAGFIGSIEYGVLSIGADAKMKDE